MKALTLWRPWDQAILRSSKNIENRDWPFPPNMLGKRIALHAGKTYDVGDWPWPSDFKPKSKKESPSMAIVGVVTLVGWIGPSVNGTRTTYGHRERMLSHLNNQWFSDRGYGWVLDERIEIEPVPCRGAMGLWTVPLEIAWIVESRIAKRT